MLRLSLAWLHLVALGLGLGAVIYRGSALRELPAAGALKRAFRSDALWGIAALLWIATGVWRLLGATEKGVMYYMTNHAFFAKMGLFVAILLLELWPMITLIRWRAALARGGTPESVVHLPTAKRLAIISHVEALLVVAIVFAAVAMARGYGSIR